MNDYYKARGVSLAKKVSLYTPRYMIPYLAKDKDAFILDIIGGIKAVAYNINDNKG